MQKYTISIQNGLEDVEKLLIEQGHTVFPFSQSGLQADVVIITGVDSAYEEIETAQCRLGENAKELLLINATGLNHTEIISIIDKNKCGIS